MILSHFGRFYFQRRGVVSPHATTVMLTHHRLKLAPVLDLYLREKKILNLQQHLIAWGRQQVVTAMNAKLLELCNATLASNGISGQQLYAVLAEVDKEIAAIVAEAALVCPAYRFPVVFAPSERQDPRPFLTAILSQEQILFHYTDATGFDRIMAAKAISPFRTDELRQGAKLLVYVSKPPYCLPPEQVHQIVFLGEARYARRGDYLIALRTATPVEQGTQPGEWTCSGAIRFADGVVLYAGENPFSCIQL